MSKAIFYRLPVKAKTVYAPRRRQPPPAVQELELRGHGDGGPAPQPAYHPAPQFRRNRRFWLRRLGLDKAQR